MAYGKKYYMSFERTFTNPKGENQTKKYLFNIYFQGYTGSPIELPCMGASPVVLRYDGEKDNIFEPIVKGSMEFELVNQTGFVFDDMIEAGDADCWCELCELGVTTPTITGYMYSDNFVRIEQNPSGQSGSPATISGYEFRLGGETILLSNTNNNTLSIPYADTASFPIQSQQVFVFLLNHLNTLFTGKGVIFVDAGNNVMQVKSVTKLDLLLDEPYTVGNSKVLVRPSYINSEPTPIIENVGTQSLIFSGFLSPAGIVRSYTNAPHIMRFVASDGLNLLNGISYGNTQSDLGDVKILDVIKNALKFRNNITDTAIKDDLFIEWDFKGNTSQGQPSGGSETRWIMNDVIMTQDVLLVSYEAIVRVYRLDGIAYDTYVFKNKGDYDKIILDYKLGTYNQTQINALAYYKLYLRLNELLATVNINTSYIQDGVVGFPAGDLAKIVGIKSSAKIFFEKIYFYNGDLQITNTYTPSIVSELNIESLTIEGHTLAGKSIFEAIEGLLKSFGWRMYYYKGWRIDRVLNIGKSTRMFKKYAAIGNNAIDINMGSIKDEGAGFYIEGGATETRVNSWRDGIFKQPYGKKESLIYNNFDTKDFAYSPEYNSYRYKWASGTAYCLKDKSGKNLLIGVGNNAIDYAIFKGVGTPNSVIVKYVGIANTANSARIKMKIGSKWLNEDGTLSDVEKTISKRAEPNGEVKFEIQIAANTGGQLVLFLSNQILYSETEATDALVSEFSVGAYYLNESSIGYELQLNINQLNRNKTKEVEFLVGTTLDAPQYPSYYSGLIKSNGQPVYAISDGLNTGRLADIIANEYAYVYARNRMCVSGTLLQNVEPNDSFKFANGRMLTFASIGGFDIKRNTLDGEFVEVVSQPYILYTADLPVINIAPLDTATLPTQVLCTYSDGTAANAPITWKPFTETYPGTYTANGYIGVNIKTVEQKIIIGNIVSYTPLADVTVGEGMTPSLPSTAHCTTDNGFTRDYAITWGQYSTAIQGTFVVKGHLFNGFDVSVNMVVTAALSDLDVLRQIRDANPTSQLPALWLETEDPYTQWEGVGWNSSKTRCISLEVQSKAIKTLQYVNKLTALQTLYCYYNQLTALDVTGLSSLQTLYCGGNQLTALDITGLIGLVELHCTDNQIRTLNATQLTSLQRLECDSNQLTALDVTGLSSLQTLYCSYNQLTALDVTGLSALQALYCSYNRLTSMPSVTAKGLIAAYDFINNKFPTSELDRFRTMGFTDESKLLPQNP